MNYIVYNFKHQTVPTLFGVTAGLLLSYVGFGQLYSAQFFIAGILIGFSLLARIE